MGYIHAISTADVLCGFHAQHHNFQLTVAQKCVLFQKFLVSLQSPEEHFLLRAVIPLSDWSAVNTPKYLGVSTAKSPDL